MNSDNAVIRVKVIQPHPWLDPIPGHPGGCIYEIFDSRGLKRAGGSWRGTDLDAVARYAADVAKRLGFTSVEINPSA